MTKIQKFTKSLIFRIALSTTALLFVFGIIVATIGYIKFNETLTDRYNEAATTAAGSAQIFINEDHIDDYLTYADKINGTEEILPGEDEIQALKDEFDSTTAKLQTFCETQNLAILYVIVPDTSNYKHYYSIFNCPNNAFVPYSAWALGHEEWHGENDSEYDDIYKQMMEGGLEQASIKRTHNLKGKLPHINSLIPLKDSNGNVVAIVCAQHTMELLTKRGTSYVLLIVITTVVLSVLSVAAYIMLVKSQFITPIHKIMNEAQRFAKENSAPDQPIIEDISHIHEISTLAAAINDMEEDTLKYIDNLSDIIAEKQKIGTELGIAKNIQEAFLPSNFPAFPDRFDFDLYASMNPAKEVGGDFYDFFLVDENHLAMVIADVSGKGIPAALFMMVTKILIYERAMLGESPAKILSFVNQRICERNPAEMFVTVWLGILDLTTGKITASNAGHDNPAILKNGRFEFFKSKRGLVIGAMEDSVYTDFEIKLEKGGLIYLFTDGVPEATNVNNQMFTLDRTLATLNTMKNASPKEIVDAINARVLTFAGEAPQFDDTTMLCVKYIGKDITVDRELTVIADIDNLPKVNDFATAAFEEQNVPKKAANQLLIALEEVFANVAHYAYPPKSGDVIIHISLKDKFAKITVKDSGTPYNPLEKQDPDVSLSANDRQEGGLGIYMTKKLVDNVQYEFVDGQNILTLEKKL